ncbi:MAG: ABC transporter substrate-binding protein [Nitrososphaerota archaeon]|nr:ABC transporter substrate-binding protein [Nitrososphaerota archaeon]
MMPNFKVTPITKGGALLEDALGRKILVSSDPASHKVETGTLILKTPVSKVVACSPIHLAFALRLEKEFGGVLDKFVGILNAAEAHLVLPELIERFRSGKIRDIRSIAELRSLQPDLVFSFIYPRDDPQLVHIMERFKLPHVVVDSWYETTYPDRVRWIEFMGQFFGLGNEAHSLVERIVEELKAIRENKRSQNRTKVIWFVDFQGYAFVTGGKSWVAKSIDELGGEVLTPDPDTPGSADATKEWISENLPKADVMVFTMVRPNVAHIEQLYPGITQTPAYKSKRIYGFSVNYWQESAYAPEKWYDELSSILSPEPTANELRVFAAARM